MVLKKNDLHTRNTPHVEIILKKITVYVVVATITSVRH